MENCCPYQSWKCQSKSQIHQIKVEQEVWDVTALQCWLVPGGERLWDSEEGEDEEQGGGEEEEAGQENLEEWPEADEKWEWQEH